MSLTQDEIMNATVFHVGTCMRSTGARGAVTVSTELWRRNGATKTWKTRPGEFVIPVKHGLRNYSTITHEDLALVHTASTCILQEST